MITPTGLYRARDTPLHRAPAWFKVLLLLAATIVMIIMDDPVSSVGLAAAWVLLLLSTQPPARTTLVAMTGAVLVAVLSSAIHLYRGDWGRAIDVSADLIGVVALALAVASSTSMTAMIELVSTVARPLRFLLPPETLGLMFALLLRALPEVAEIYLESRQAARARGLDRNLRAILYPTTTRTVGFALELGQAIHARGIGEENDQVDSGKRRARRSRRTEAARAAGRADASAARAPSSQQERDDAFDVLTRHEPRTGNDRG